MRWKRPWPARWPANRCRSSSKKPRKDGKLKALEELQRIAEAREQGFITAEQALQLERDYALRRKVIMVDDFAPEQLRAAEASG